MLDILSTILAYGPVGCITPGVAVKWTVIWTIVLGVPLYVSLYFPQWFPVDDEKH